ncbi:MAG: hypothetical protein ACFFD4_31205 [Candidatus Odinarchaeota archaeon]
MPICSTCGAYYIRPPCPACDSEQAEQGKEPTSRLRGEKKESSQPAAATTPKTPGPGYTSVITKIASLANQIEEKDRIISELETRIAEQQNRIQALQDEIVKLKN